MPAAARAAAQVPSQAGVHTAGAVGAAGVNVIPLGEKGCSQPADAHAGGVGQGQSQPIGARQRGEGFGG